MIERRDFLRSLAIVPVFGLFAQRFLVSKRSGGFLEVKHRRISDALNLSSGQYPRPATSLSSSMNTLRVGLIGNGWRGPELLRALGYAHPDWLAKKLKKGKYIGSGASFQTQEDLNVRITGICDTFRPRAESGVVISQNANGPGGETRNLEPARIFENYREMIDSDEIDAVVIATPDHWHARMAVDAARAGKHVYLEKPMVRTLDEAKKLREVIGETGVVFQLGHQNRQQVSYRHAREIVEKGVLGDITRVETFTNRNSDHGAWNREIDQRATENNVNWEEFLGDAPYHEFDPDRYFNWQKWFEYGSGPAGNQFTHAFDCVNQVLELGIPVRVSALGGKFHYTDARDIPDLFNAVFQYPERGIQMTYDCTLKNSKTRDTSILGSDASMEINIGVSLYRDRESRRYKELHRDKYSPMYVYNPKTPEVDGVTSATSSYYHERGFGYTYYDGERIDCTHLHIKEWVDAIRESRPVSCDINQGFQESACYIMANQAFHQGRVAIWDPVKEEIDFS
jgi:predicted dehydrogenase